MAQSKDRAMNEGKLQEEIESLRRRVHELTEELTAKAYVEEGLRGSEARYRQAVEESPNAIMALDALGRIVSWNRACTEITGYLSDEAVGRDSSFLIVNPDAAYFSEAVLSRVFQGDHISDLELDFRRSDNSLRKMISRAYPVRDQFNNVVECVLANTDVTRLKSAEDFLLQEHGRLEKLVQQRTADLTRTNEQLAEEIKERKTAELEVRQNEERLALALDGATLGIWDWDLTNGKAVWTERTHRMLGYEPDDVESDLKNWKRLVHSDDWPTVSENLNFHLEGREPLFDVEHRILNKYGEWQWVNPRGKVVEYGPDGKPIRMTGVIVDISERKKQEEALRDSQDLLRMSQEIARVGSWQLDFTANRLIWSDEVYRIFGVHPQEFSATYEGFLEMVHPDDRTAVDAAYSCSVREGRDSYEIEHRIVKRDSGEIRHVHEKSQHFRDSKGRINRSVGMVQDITDSKKAELALRESENKYRFLAEHASDVIWTVDLKMRTTYASPSIERVLGFTPEERIRQEAESQLTPESLAVARHALLGELMRQKAQGTRADQPIILELDFLHKDGSIVCLESVMKFIRDEKEAPIGVHGLSRDITERKKSEQALRRSEEFNRRLVDNAPFGIVYLGADGTIEYINPVANKIAGIPEGTVSPVLGWNILDLPGLQERPEVQEDLSRVIKGKSLSNIEMAYRSSVGHDTSLLFSATPRLGSDGNVTGVILMFTDISELKRAEKIQREAVRFRAVADLAGGVAHNFNNLLQIVIGNLELALLHLESGNYSDVRQALKNVLESSRFGAETVQRLQSLAGIRDHSQLLEKGVFDLSDIVRQALEMSKTWWKSIPERAGIEVCLDTELNAGCLVRGEKNELFEVVVNLIKNASDAIPEGGTIEVKTRVDGDHVVLRVRDNGIGISEENLKRLFNPFFTTKANAGSGLGLASSRKIIENGGGEIVVESLEGKGTAFTINFPLSKQPLDLAEPSVSRASFPEKRVLVIDDEEAILELMKEGLAHLGHVVFTASTGVQGLEIFNEKQPDLVICDLGMPGMNGWEVGRRIRSICEERQLPKNPFILLTGWGGQKTEVEKIAESGVDAVVEKPINIENISEIIREFSPRDHSQVSH
jgi:two-component system cell cycle sensor histidine kinase/response regulator CckA